MFWADKIAKELAQSKKPQLVDDAKTPSGRVHVGSLRGVIIHDLVYKALGSQKVKTSYTFIYDDMDPMDGLPGYLTAEKYEPYMGVPLKDIPAPEGSESYAEYYANEFTNVFNRLGTKPKILWSSKLYESSKLDKYIKLALDNAEKIQEIYEGISGSRRPKDFLPFQPICEKCGKVGTTVSTGWDGSEVSYECSLNRVEWAQGCSHKGKVSPFGGTGKMPFRVEWPAKWAALGVTVEGAGKDHISKGGTRDTAVEICKEIFGVEPPYNIPYEHFLYGGKKMSSSKGVGASAAEVAEILPPEVLRFLMVRPKPTQHIDFDPTAPHTMPKLFDDFDAARGSKDEDLKRIYELSQVNEDRDYFVPRFSDLLNITQMPNIGMEKWAEEQKGKELTNLDKEKLEERVKYVKIYLEEFAPEKIKFDVKDKLPQEAIALSEKQKMLLQKISNLLDEAGDPEEFQNDIYQSGKGLELSSKDTFKAIYLTLLGKSSGPKAAWLIMSLDKEFVRKRFEEASR